MNCLKVRCFKIFQIQGAILVVPLAIRTEPGQITEGEDNQSSSVVVQTIETVAGAIQIAIPVEHVDDVVKGLTVAKDGAEKQPKKSDLYVPGSQQEADAITTQISKVTDEVRAGRN